MTILSSPQALPRQDRSTGELADALRRSNHDTAFAGWAVCTMAVGVLFQVTALLAVEQAWLRLALTGLLLPLLAAGLQITRLLDRASAAIPETTDTSLLLAGLETRRAWTAKAALWTYMTGAAFGVWTVAVQLLTG